MPGLNPETGPLVFDETSAAEFGDVCCVAWGWIDCVTIGASVHEGVIFGDRVVITGTTALCRVVNTISFVVLSFDGSGVVTFGRTVVGA